MDASWARRVIDQACENLKSAGKATGRSPAQIGLGDKLGLAAAGIASCGGATVNQLVDCAENPDDEQCAEVDTPPPQETEEDPAEAVDLYGAPPLDQTRNPTPPESSR